MGRAIRQSTGNAVGRFLLAAVALVLAISWGTGIAAESPKDPAGQSCVPTRADSEGPFYLPGAPLTTSTGSGLTVAGRVLGAPDCRPVPGARVEWWQTDRSGRYGDAHRGSQAADPDGTYRFTTDFPGAYPGRPPHIHFKASAPGYRPLTTQLYLRGGEREVSFPIVLVPR